MLVAFINKQQHLVLIVMYENDYGIWTGNDTNKSICFHLIIIIIVHKLESLNFVPELLLCFIAE